MPLVRAEYNGLLRRIAARSKQGRNIGGETGSQQRGARSTIPRRRITMRAPKSPYNVTSSSVQYIFFRKTSGSNMGRQTCFLPRAPCNHVAPLAVIQYSSALSMYMESGVAQLHSYVIILWTNRTRSMHFCHIAPSCWLTSASIAFHTLHYDSTRRLVPSRNIHSPLCCKPTMETYSYCGLTNCTGNSPETDFSFSFWRLVKSWVSSKFSILRSYFNCCLFFRGCHQALKK